MIAVIFEVYPNEAGQEEYLALAAGLRDRVQAAPGFISIERFQSLTDPGKLVSLSFWEDEDAVNQWRKLEVHRAAQARGRDELFLDYRIRVAEVIRDYSLQGRDQAPD